MFFFYFFLSLSFVFRFSGKSKTFGNGKPGTHSNWFCWLVACRGMCKRYEPIFSSISALVIVGPNGNAAKINTIHGNMTVCCAICTGIIQFVWFKPHLIIRLAIHFLIPVGIVSYFMHFIWAALHLCECIFGFEQ